MGGIFVGLTLALVRLIKLAFEKVSFYESVSFCDEECFQICYDRLK